jgi:hypothetical protein
MWKHLFTDRRGRDYRRNKNGRTERYNKKLEKWIYIPPKEVSRFYDGDGKKNIDDYEKKNSDGYEVKTNDVVLDQKEMEQELDAVSENLWLGDDMFESDVMIREQLKNIESGVIGEYTLLKRQVINIIKLVREFPRLNFDAFKIKMKELNIPISTMNFYEYLLMTPKELKKAIEGELVPGTEIFHEFESNSVYEKSVANYLNLDSTISCALKCIGYNFNDQQCFNFAASNGCIGFMKILIRNKSSRIDLRVLDTDNFLFQDVSAKGHLNVLKYIISIHDSRNTSVNVDMAMKMAVRNGHTRVVDYLRFIDSKHKTRQVQFANSGGKCAKLENGEVVEWESTESSAEEKYRRVPGVKDAVELYSIDRVPRKKCAFAVKLRDGKVVTWGASTSEAANSKSVQDKLVDVVTIYSNKHAFVAKRKDGTLITWGTAGCGGDSESVQDKLKNVVTVFSTDEAFAAKLKDGTLVTWGKDDRGGDSTLVKKQLVGVETVTSTCDAFAAKLKNGSVVTWGKADQGGDSKRVQWQLVDVDTVYSTQCAFAARTYGGTVVTWGHSESGGDSRHVQEKLVDVDTICPNNYSFAAKLNNGRVVFWNSRHQHIYNADTIEKLRDVHKIYSHFNTFGVIYRSGEVLTWGLDISRNEEYNLLRNAETMYPNHLNFMVKLENRSVVVLTQNVNGYVGVDELVDVVSVYPTRHAFAIELENGSIVVYEDSFAQKKYM